MNKRQHLTISHKSCALIVMGIILVGFLSMSVAFAEIPTYNWLVTEIPDPLSQSYRRVDPSLALDNQDRPHISFGVNEGSDAWPTHIYYTYKESTSWQGQQLVWKPYACAETSIFLDSNSKVHIAYATEWGQGVWYITNKTGSWQEETLKGTWTGNYESMCSDDNGNFHLAYWNNDLNAERIHYKFHNGAGWQAVEWVDESVNTDIKEYSYMMKPVTVITTHGANPVPYIVAGRKNGGLKYYYKIGGSWSDPVNFGNEYNILQDSNGVMAFDSNNTLYCMVQLDATPQKLYLGIKGPTQWSYEEITQLSSGSLVRASLVIDTLNQVHVVYVNGQDIFYKVREGTTWSTPQKINLEPISYGPKDLEIKLNSADKPQIVYSTVYPQKIYYVETERPNSPPEIDQPIGPKSVNEGELLTFPVPAPDPDGDIVTYSLEAIVGKNYPEGATLGKTSGIFEWTPNATQSGIYEGRIKASDGKGGEDYEDVQITVYDVDVPPVLEPIPPKTVKEGEVLTFTVSAEDPDGDTLTYSIEPIIGKDYPDKARLYATTGIFRWVPQYDDTGDYELLVKASDGKGGEDTEVLKIAVLDVPAMILQRGDYIQEAIDDSTRPEKVILIPGGEYSGDLVIDDDVALVGDTPYSTVIKGHITVKEATVTIANLTISYGEGSAVSFNNAYYQDFKLINDAGITAINSDITVRNCIIRPDENFLATLPDGKNLYYGKGIQIWNLYENPAIEPQIENSLIRNTECGIFYFSQAFAREGIYGTIRNNTFYQNKVAVLLRMHKENPSIYNNIFHGCVESILHYTYKDLLTERRSSIDYNVVSLLAMPEYELWVDETGVGYPIANEKANIAVEPFFIDAEDESFYLDPDSPCVSKGKEGDDIGAYSTDKEPPSLENILPADKKFMGPININISGNVYDDNGIMSVYVNSEKAIVNGNTFIAEGYLLSDFGLNDLNIIATDVAKKTAVTTKTIYLLRTPEAPPNW